MANTYTDLLKLRMPALGDIGWDDEINDNTEIFEFTVAPVLKGNRIVSGLAPSDGGGLDIDIAAGTVVVNGAVYTLSATTKTCTASNKNYLIVDDTGALDVATELPTGNFVAIAVIDTDLASILRFSDARVLAQSMLAFTVAHTPKNYEVDTGEDAQIDQHIAGLDNQIGAIGYRKNYLDNGDFQIWQRATSQSTDGIKSDDRWVNANSGSFATASHQQQAFALGQAAVPGEPRFYSQTIISSVGAAGVFVQKYQKLLNVRILAGQTVTISFYASADTNRYIYVRAVQEFGSGGSPAVATVSDSIQITSSWAKYTATLQIPSIAGKTIGTGVNDIIISIAMSSGTNYSTPMPDIEDQTGTFNFSNIQCELGTVATDFEQVTFVDNLLRCLPYYQKTYDYETAPGTNTNVGRQINQVNSVTTATGAIYTTWTLSVPMIVTPTVKLYSLAGNAGYVTVVGGEVAGAVIISKRYIEASAVDSTSSNVRSLAFHAVADTGY